MNRKAEAALYHQAAQLLESREQSYGCEALKAVGLSNGYLDAVFREDAIQYEETYAGKPARVAYFANGIDPEDDFDETSRNHRILALCFLAAMAEAGDLHD